VLDAESGSFGKAGDLRSDVSVPLAVLILTGNRPLAALFKGRMDPEGLGLSLLSWLDSMLESNIPLTWSFLIPFLISRLWIEHVDIP
jgi:hypothetical protein